MALPPKRQRFVDEYLIDLNGARAYRAAGYSARTDTAASAGAARLLANASIQEAVQAGRLAQQQRTHFNADQVLREYARLAFSDIGDVLDFSQTEPRLRAANDISEAARRSISSVKVKRYMEGAGDDAQEVEVVEFKLWSKVDALGKLLRHLGIEEPAKPDKPLQVDVTSGGKPLDRNSLTPADVAAAAALVGMAGLRISADARPQPVDPGQPPRSAAAVPPSQ